jgi:predicted helicase
MVAVELSDEQLADKYSIKSNRDWKIGKARAALRESKSWQKKVMQCSYRPFDNPFSFFGTEFMDYPRRELMDHVAGKETLSLVASRQTASASWRHAFIASNPANDCLISDQSSEANQVFPLWKFVDQQDAQRENFTSQFRAFLDSRYDHHYTPEEVLGYIYAVLHAPAYRARYAEFLRIDFPRIPFPENADDFETLSRLGWALVQAHLLRELPRQKLAGYHGKGEHVVEAVRYASAEETVWINETQSSGPSRKTCGTSTSAVTKYSTNI